MLVTDDVAGQLSELDLTGSTFEANVDFFSLQRFRNVRTLTGTTFEASVDFFSLQRFRNVRTLRLAKCRKLTDGELVAERYTSGTGQEPRPANWWVSDTEVLDLSECPSIKGMG